MQELKKIGADIEYIDERLIITPRELQDRPIELSSHNDHRLAMILLLLKQVLPSIIIDNTDCIRKSAPEFLAFFKNYL
jgi:3-phosphoshikimate 1-carboxyvinyltransferase